MEIVFHQVSVVVMTHDLSTTQELPITRFPSLTAVRPGFSAFESCASTQARPFGPYSFHNPGSEKILVVISLPEEYDDWRSVEIQDSPGILGPISCQVDASRGSAKDTNEERGRVVLTS
jgi:hypothetical protein